VDMDDKYKNRKSIFSMVVISVAVIYVIIVSAYLLMRTQDFVVSIDFPFFVSLVVSFFALALSISFYFKASDTSNRFYDNTYKFTKDISEKIGRMDERFAEHLIGIKDDIKEINPSHFRQSKKKLEDELLRGEKEASDVSHSIKKILDEILELSNLSSEEKKKYADDINGLIEEKTSKKQKIKELETTINMDLYDAENVLKQLRYAKVPIEMEKDPFLNPELLEEDAAYPVVVYVDKGINVYNRRITIYIYIYQQKCFFNRDDPGIVNLVSYGLLQPEKFRKT